MRAAAQKTATEGCGLQMCAVVLMMGCPVSPVVQCRLCGPMRVPRRWVRSRALCRTPRCRSGTPL